MAETNAVERHDLIDQLAGTWKPREIRELAGNLLRLANSLDKQRDASNVESVFRWPNELARIERNSINLAMKAKLIYEQRGRLREFIPGDLLGGPAWDMLLDLFMQFAGGAKVSITSLCLAARVPSTTALRYIAALNEAGLVTRSTSEFDKRVTYIGLTESGVLAVGKYLEQYG